MQLALKSALRHLQKTPGFTLTAVATLALCIGVNLTIFAVVDTVLVRPLPFPDSGRLVAVTNSYPGAGVPKAGASMPNYFDRRHSIAAFSSVSLFQEWSTIVGGAGSSQRVPIARVSPEFFATLGVPLAAGQCFTDAQLSYSTDQVAVITDGFWRSHFGSDPNVVGKTFMNDGLTVTVVGVLPASFRYLSSRAQFFRPVSHAPEDRAAMARHNNNYSMIARLAPGVSVEEAQAQMNAFNAKQSTDDPVGNLIKEVNYHTVVASLHEDHVAEVKPVLLLLQLGVLVLFLIGAVNLANLLLIRASSRVKEYSVRRALGAASRHVVFEAVLETTLLALGGGLVGTLIAAFGIDLLRLLGTDKLPLGVWVTFDHRIGVAAIVGSIFAGVLLAIPTIWFNFRVPLADGLQSESRTGTTGRGTQRLRHFFIVAQIALAFVLLSGAGLLSLSLDRVLSISPGFDSSQVLTGNIALPWKKYPQAPDRFAFVQRLVPALQALPGVTQAAISSALPFNGSRNDSAVFVEGFQPKPGESVRAHYLSAIYGNYFQAMHIQLLRGRLLEDSDDLASAQVCVVDRAFADRYWPGENPIGHRVSTMAQGGSAAFQPDHSFTIVGVVNAVKQDNLSEVSGHGAVYFPIGKFDQVFFSIVVRTALPPEALANAVQNAVRRLDPDLPVDDLRPLQDRIEDSLVARRSPAILAVLFATVALLLAAIGTYGVLSYSVSQRRREIGVRMALGALPKQIRVQFVALGVQLLLVGTLLGVLGAWVAGRAMQSILFGVPAMDIPVLLVTALVLSALALTACLLPASRAASIDPMSALRAD